MRYLYTHNYTKSLYYYYLSRKSKYIIHMSKGCATMKYQLNNDSLCERTLDLIIIIYLLNFIYFYECHITHD